MTLNGVKLPYYAAKIADESIFAAFHAGTDVYGCVFDSSKSVTPDRVPKSAGATTPGILSTAICVDTTENPARAVFAFNTEGDFPNTETDFTGNVVEWNRLGTAPMFESWRAQGKSQKKETYVCVKTDDTTYFLSYVCADTTIGRRAPLLGAAF